MGSPKMKLLLQLTVIAGLCYSAIAQQFCDPATKNCCQQLLKCNGICSVKHPEPDNVAAWYSHSFCDEKRGCRCWTKGQCCELENKKCVDNGTCTLGIPPKDANFVAAFSCDESAPVASVKKTDCFCWQRKPCVPITKCKDPNALCQHYKPTLPGRWKDTGYCNWLTDCKCWSKKCEVQTKCELKRDKCRRQKPDGNNWFELNRKCNEDGCGCCRKCRQRNWCKNLNGVCQPTSPGSSYKALGRLCKEGCYCWVEQQDPECPKNVCPFGTDECSKVSPGTTWSDVGEYKDCSGNGCSCWRQCEQDDACSKRQGKCFAKSPGSKYELIGDCKNGCQCWRPCYDEECDKKGGRCSSKDPNPIGQSLYARDGVCKGECVCWVRQKSNCPEGGCKLDTDECAKTSPGDTWLNVGETEKCRGNGCTCWRSCNDDKCNERGGKCYGPDQPIPNDFIRIGACKGRCSCYKPNVDLE